MAQTNGGKSLWMQNFAVRSANMGHNVLYITLEMSERKVMKKD
jgi:KaiC/GvpD/RAD55 family RecA-like ATPase